MVEKYNTNAINGDQYWHDLQNVRNYDNRSDFPPIICEVLRDFCYFRIFVALSVCFLLIPCLFSKAVVAVSSSPLRLSSLLFPPEYRSITVAFIVHLP